MAAGNEHVVEGEAVIVTRSQFWIGKDFQSITLCAENDDEEGIKIVSGIASEIARSVDFQTVKAINQIAVNRGVQIAVYGKKRFVIAAVDGMLETLAGIAK